MPGIKLLEIIGTAVLFSMKTSLEVMDIANQFKQDNACRHHSLRGEKRESDTEERKLGRLL